MHIYTNALWDMHFIDIIYIEKQALKHWNKKNKIWEFFRFVIRCKSDVCVMLYRCATMMRSSSMFMMCVSTSLTWWFLFSQNTFLWLVFVIDFFEVEIEKQIGGVKQPLVSFKVAVYLLTEPIMDSEKVTEHQSYPLLPDVKTTMMDACFESVNHNPRRHLFITLPACVCVSLCTKRKTSWQEIVWQTPRRARSLKQNVRI